MRSILLILALCVIAVASAQPATDQDLFAVRLRLKARSFGDSVVLRWGISNAAAWPYFSDAGYTIERLAMTAANQPLDKDWKVLADSVKPWSKAQLSIALQQPQFRNDDYFKLAAGLLYGNDADATRGKVVPHSMIDDIQASESKFGFALLSADLSPNVARMLGFSFADRDVQPGMRYLYRVRMKGTPGAFHADSAISFVDMAVPYEALPPARFTATPAEHKVLLAWRCLPLAPQYTAYWIERSADNKQYTRLNDKPYLMMRREGSDVTTFTYVDSLTENNQKMYYRVIGIDAFGQESQPTRPVLAGGADRTFSMSVSISAIQRGPRGNATINWVTSNPPADLLGFYVYSKPDEDGNYTQLSKLLPPATKTFTDDSAGTQSYYMVAAFDTAGNLSMSEPYYTFLPDSIAPAVPTGLAGTIDTAGTVTLHWPLGQDGDIRGYRIYAANQADHQFTPILESPLDDTVYQYKTTLQTLTKNIYFKIAAVDASGNHSIESAVLTLTRPDKVAPVAPVITEYLVTDTAVTVNWNRSSSKDVAMQQLYRRPAGTTSWQLIASPSLASASYSDHDVKGGQELEYALVATDSSGLQSEYSFPLKARVYTVAPASGISNLKSLATNGAVKLSWQNEHAAGQIIIARSYNGSGFAPVAQVSTKEKEWTDALLPGNGKYQYRLQHIATDGKKSEWLSGTPINVTVQ